MEEKNITYRTRIHYIVPSQELINEARLSNNLYNQTLYILRQAFINEELQAPFIVGTSSNLAPV